MNPLSLIPAPWLIWVRIAVIVLLAGLCFGAGWRVNGARMEAKVADVKLQHSDAVLVATKKALAGQLKVDAEHQAKATALAAIDTTHHQELTRLQDENDRLRADVGAGTRSVRIRATCADPGRPAGVPQAAAGGRVDPGAGAVLDPEAGRLALDLRADAIRIASKLSACQQALGCITGQGTCTPAASP